MTIYTSTSIYRPISNQTAKALGWYESKNKSKDRLKVKSSNTNNFPVICPVCKVQVSRKNLEKHVTKVHNPSKKKDKLKKNSQLELLDQTTFCCCLLCKPKKSNRYFHGMKTSNFDRHITNCHSKKAKEILKNYYDLVNNQSSVVSTADINDEIFSTETMINPDDLCKVEILTMQEKTIFKNNKTIQVKVKKKRSVTMT